MTNIEHFWSHTMNIAHFLSHTTKHTTNTTTVLRFCNGTTPSVALADASGLVGDAKRLCLPHFDAYLSVSDNLKCPSFHLILHTVVNPTTQKLYIKYSILHG